MTQDWTSPTNGDLISDYSDELLARDEHIAKMDFTGDTNIPAGFIRANESEDDNLERYGSGVWTTLAFITNFLAHMADEAIHEPIPSGSIMATGRATAPTGWILCDGTAISRVTYAALFAAIGTAYGVGDGSTTFNLPDLRGKFALGKAVSGTGNTLGGTGGAIDHTHSTPNHTHSIPAHTHDLGNHVHAGPSHRHTVSDHTHTIPAHYHGVTGNGATIAISNSGTHVHGVKGKTGGSDGSGSNRAQGASSTSGTNVTFTDATDGGSAHDHANGSFSGYVGNVSGAISGDITITSSSSGSGYTSYDGTGNTGVPVPNLSGSGGSGTSGSDGASTTGTANPPFQVVNYIIKE
jgi:microcystin-dependent protein